MGHARRPAIKPDVGDECAGLGLLGSGEVTRYHVLADASRGLLHALFGEVWLGAGLHEGGESTIRRPQYIFR